MALLRSSRSMSFESTNLLSGMEVVGRTIVGVTVVCRKNGNGSKR